MSDSPEVREYVRWSLLRTEVEHHQKWRDWTEKVPQIPMRDGWSIAPIPPFSGALARFYVFANGDRVSIYLDVDNSLGFHDGPYWEVYGGNMEDPDRCGMNDVDELLRIIERALPQPPQDVSEEVPDGSSM